MLLDQAGWRLEPGKSVRTKDGVELVGALHTPEGWYRGPNTQHTRPTHPTHPPRAHCSAESRMQCKTFCE